MINIYEEYVTRYCGDINIGTGGETSSLRNELMNGQAGGKIELDDTGFFSELLQHTIYGRKLSEEF